MNDLKNSRRFIVTMTGMVLLTILGLVNKVDVSMAIASVAIGLSAANAYQKKPK